MTPARMRRLSSDYEEVKKNFAGHKNIIVTPVGDEPPEKYHVTYFVNGIYLLPDGRIETLGRHEVDITLHADYPRYKPICKITTPIWHPNFRDGQICIGDIWGAGESLSDIIINIGDMIQYKSWNSYSPLSSEAAQWAMENKHLFPVGNIDLFYSDYASAKDTVEIDLFNEEETKAKTETATVAATTVTPTSEISNTPLQPLAETTMPPVSSADLNENDFEITAEELAGIEFVPTAQRMQTVSHGGLVKGNKVNFKTILVKGLLWALIGAFVGFGISELSGSNDSHSFIAKSSAILTCQIITTTAHRLTKSLILRIKNTKFTAKTMAWILTVQQFLRIGIQGKHPLRPSAIWTIILIMTIRPTMQCTKHINMISEITKTS